jgi:D-alanyl-D-alanine carboxypeptidase (penicillin-binding protein 5/6)
MARLPSRSDGIVSMTAYVVLRDHPLQPGEHGPTLTLTAAEVADTERRRGRGESVVPVAAGEQLTELQALLLPSANNLAAVLARWAAGSEARFVARLNATTRSLGMTDTRYTDPRVTTRRRCRLPPEETPCIEHCKRSSLLR